MERCCPNKRVEPTALSWRFATGELPSSKVISQWLLCRSGGGSRAGRYAWREMMTTHGEFNWIELQTHNADEVRLLLSIEKPSDGISVRKKCQQVVLIGSACHRVNQFAGCSHWITTKVVANQTVG